MLWLGNQNSAKFWRRVLLSVIARFHELRIPEVFDRPGDPPDTSVLHLPPGQEHQPAPNTSSGDPSEVADGEVKAHLGIPGKESRQTASKDQSSTQSLEDGCEVGAIIEAPTTAIDSRASQG
jgi:hypothetical protein